MLNTEQHNISNTLNIGWPTQEQQQIKSLYLPFIKTVLQGQQVLLQIILEFFLAKELSKRQQYFLKNSS